MKSFSYPPACCVWVIEPVKVRVGWMESVPAAIWSQSPDCCSTEMRLSSFSPHLPRLLRFNWHSTLKHRVISFLIQSDACQLAADIHSYTAITPGHPNEMCATKAPSLLLSAAPTLIPHNNHLLPIIAKQQQNLKLSDNAPFHFPQANNFYRGIVLLRAAKGLILNTGLVPTPSQDGNHEQHQQPSTDVTQLYE